MALCAAICCRYLMLNGFHKSCINGNTSSDSNFPHKWDEWVQMLSEGDSCDWIASIQDSLYHENYYMYKDLTHLAEALYQMKDYGYCLQVSWMLVLFEEALNGKCEGLGYIYASKVFEATGMSEAATLIEEKIEAKVGDLQNSNLDGSNANIEPAEKWSPILSFLAYIEHFVERGLKTRSAKLLMFVKDKFNISDFATAVKLKYYLLAAEIEASFNRYESASMNLSHISASSEVKGGLQFWKKYISLYIDTKLGLGHVLQDIHNDLDNVKSIFEMILKRRSNK